MLYSASNEVWSLMKELSSIHNQVCFGELKQQARFNEYVIQHENKLNHPLILEILLANIELTDDFIKNNEVLCKTVARIISRTDLESSEISLSTTMRIKFFEEMVRLLGWSDSETDST